MMRPAPSPPPPPLPTEQEEGESASLSLSSFPYCSIIRIRIRVLVFSCSVSRQPGFLVCFYHGSYQVPTTDRLLSHLAYTVYYTVGTDE